MTSPGRLFSLFFCADAFLFPVPGIPASYLFRHRREAEHLLKLADVLLHIIQKRAHGGCGMFALRVHHAPASAQRKSRQIQCVQRAQLQFQSEEHTSELQSRENLVCRLLLEKKKEKYEEQT